MNIIVDTREQLPYDFKSFFKEKLEPVECVKIDTLKTGDYTIKGFEDMIIVERKTKNDFLSTITRDRERFEKELDRMSVFKYALVVIEGTFDSVLDYAGMHTRINRNSILGSVASFLINFKNIHFEFLKNREDAESFVYRYFRAFMKNKTLEEK